MNPALAAIAAITVGGAVLAVSVRDVRATILGLLVVLLGTPLIDDPWPGPLPILARTAATLLAVRLLEIGLRADVTTSGTRIGWPAEALLAAAAVVVGFGSHGLGARGFGPPEAQAAGFGLIMLAVAPLATGRDVLRIAVGAVLLLVGAGLVRTGLGNSARDAEQLIWALLTIALGGAVAVIATAARAAGGLDVVGALGRDGRRPRPPDAHRPAELEKPPTPPRRPSMPGRGLAPVRPPVPSARPRRTDPGDPLDGGST